MKKRFNYILWFTFFLISVFIFYFWDPFSLATKYFGASTFAILFVGVFLIGMMINYTLLFSTKEQLKEQNTVWDYFVKTFIIGSSLGISGGFLYWILKGVNHLHSTSSIVAFIINLLLLLVMLGLVFKVLMSSQFIQTSPFVRFITNFIFYIPCIFVSIIDTIVIFFSRQNIDKIEIGNRTEFILLGFGLLLIGLYFTLPYLENYISLQGGTQLINEPIYTNSQYDLASYIQLNNINTKDINKKDTKIIYDYDYGISFWLYIDSNATSRDKYMTIFNYGDKPRVLYKSSTNTMMITEQSNESMPTNPINNSNIKNIQTNITDTDDNGNRIIYKRKNILLQKWNNIIMNYSGGTLDIFYNGELVKSEPNVVPYMTMDTLSVGENNGINGGICNLVYFKNTLTKRQIYYLYNSVKDKNPPSLYSSTKTITNALSTK